MKRFAIAAALVSFGVSVAFAGPIEDRQALMKGIAGATKEAAGYAKGTTPFDAAKVKALLQVYVDGAAKLPTLFPEDSKTGGTDPTTASPKIWEDMAGFKAHADKLGADATAAMAATDQASFAKAFGVIASNCNACHGVYRVKKG
ncbi:c-type cytochrome [Labrys monachus]|uniref:Cytochrome c556 n=1 Tax=Labrys monachus TaxID=217067 RepID=A0ABU0FCL9_9HYPH|nr:cytochrome c [Labrys monachus]MDQ0392353.1 cytochrome c556 [Labrys monachus]